MIKIHIIENLLEADNVEVHENVADIADFLNRRFPMWPKGACIYSEAIAEMNLIELPQPNNPPELNKQLLNRITSLEGDVWIVNYPEFTVGVIIAIIVGVVAVGLAFLLRPNSSANLKNTQDQSPNNSLSNRQNTDRPGERIPDIAGTVRSTPDLIAVPYRIFLDSQEIEICYMAIGVGKYTIHDVLDDTTPIEEIAGSSVEVYAPHTNPNTGAPILTIGTPIKRPVYNVRQSSSVNGQILPAPNTSSLVGSSNIRFVYPDVIETNGSGIDFTQDYIPGNSIDVFNSNVNDPTGGLGTNLDGIYLILAVSQNQITLANPNKQNGNWNLIGTFATQNTTYGSPTITGMGDSWIGPFILNVTDLTNIYNNVVATNGLYLDDGTTQSAINVEFECEVTAVDGNNNPIGSPYYYQDDVPGSATVRTTRGVTQNIVPPMPGACQVRMRRATPKNTTFAGTVVDEIQWRDCYSISPAIQADFGDITTIMSQSYATAGALSVKTRKLNCLVTRWVERRKFFGGKLQWAGNGSNLGPSDNAADILMHFALDPNNGNRLISQIDQDGIADICGDVVPGEASINIPRFDGMAQSSVDGSISPVAGYWVSDTILCYPGETLQLHVTDNPGGSYLSAIAFLQADGTFLASGPIGPYAAGQTFVVPDGAMYVRITGTDAVLATQKLNRSYQLESQIQQYFGTPLVQQFGYTFDDSNVSFEELFTDICQAIFCYPYRRGGDVLGITFEGKTANSKQLFTHRNKVPNSETRTFNFGPSGGFDGIELTYVEPLAPNFPNVDTSTTLYFPANRSYQNANKITALGVRNQVQAMMLGNRYYNKLLYQNLSTEFEATEEGELALPYSRILVADETRSDVIDGDVLDVHGLILSLSQEHTLPDGETDAVIYLQHSNGSVEMIPCLPVAGENKQVALQSAPSLPLITDITVASRLCQFLITVPTRNTRTAAMLLTEKTPQDKFTWKMSCINYDDRYYQNDTDFINGIVSPIAPPAGGTGYPAPPPPPDDGGDGGDDPPENG
jgi:hypothetical protein